MSAREASHVEYTGRLMVTTDAAAPGSSGRVYLDLTQRDEPGPMAGAALVGLRYRTIGSFHHDNTRILLAADGSALATKSVTKDRVLWWKNGVVDLGLLSSHHCDIFELSPRLLVVVLGAIIPRSPEATKLPPYQLTLL